MNSVPSSSLMLFAVMELNAPDTFNTAPELNTNPAGFIRNKFAPGKFDAVSMVPEMVEGLLLVIRPRMFVVGWLPAF